VRLLYLHADVRRTAPAPALPEGFNWLTYSDDVHDTFAAPFIKPVFAIINCVPNSPTHGLNTVMLTAVGAPGGGTEAEWAAMFADWRGRIDSVEAPPPALTDVRHTTSGGFHFTFPGQRGKTNQVLASPDLASWTVLASFYGTNVPIVFRDTNVVSNPRRFYRLRRL